MKRILAIILAILILIAPVYADEDNALKKVEKHAKKIKDLVDKYKKAEVDFVKQEVVTITDTEGKPQDCDVAIYYNNGKQARFKTKNGKFDNNFNHGKKVPTKPFSLRLSGCACKPIEIKHTATWLQINEVIEKIKKVVEDEVADYAKDKAKEFAEDATKKVFEKLGYGASASGFLAGFGAGAAMGAPIGDYITSNINKILEAFADKNLAATKDLGDVSPLYPNIGWVKPRGGWGNYWGEDPQLKNNWDITVKCGKYTIKPPDATWTPIKPKPRAQTPAGEADDDEEPEDEYGETNAQRRARERQEREDKAREDKERRDREAKEKRERAEAKRRYEERQRQLRQKAQEIARTCPLCDPIRKQIEDISGKIKDKEQEIPGLENAEADAEKALGKAKRKLEAAKRKLSEFRNPQSYVEDSKTGKRVTTTDLEVQRQLSIDNWNRYQRGEQTADETMNNWEKQSDPATHEKAKKDAEARLKDAINKAEKNVENKQNKHNDAKKNLNRAKQQLNNLRKQLEDLKKKLEDCLKLCKKYALDIARGRITDIEGLFYYQEQTSQTATAPADTTKPKTQCERYKQLIASATNNKLTVSDWEKMSKDMKKEFTGPGMIKAIAEAKKLCGKEAGTLISQQPTTAQQTTQVVTQQPDQAKSCEEICASRSMLTQRKDWTSRILNTLNSEGVCKASAKIQFPQMLKTGECTCYSTSPPSVSINPESLVCKSTKCGDVPCGSSRQCSCGENCLTTVSCNWGGWKQLGDTFKAVAGVVET